MADESLFHRVLAMGAAALAIFGGVGMVNPASYQPAPVPPITVVVNPDEQHAQKTAPQISYFEAKEIPAGTPPLQNYCVETRGPDGIKRYQFAVPIHHANPFAFARTPALDPFWKAEWPETPGEPVKISYQPTEGAPHLEMNAPPEVLHALGTNWAKAPITFRPGEVTDVRITPAKDAGGDTHILILQPEHKAEEIDWSKVLETLAAGLGLLEKVAEWRKKRREEAATESKVPPCVEDGALVLAGEGGAKEVVLRTEDLAKAEENDRKLVAAWGTSVQSLFDQWTAALQQRELSADPVVNAEVDARITTLEKSMCDNLTRLKDYVRRTGRSLAGFQTMQAVCQG